MPMARIRGPRHAIASRFHYQGILFCAADGRLVVDIGDQRVEEGGGLGGRLLFHDGAVVVGCPTSRPLYASCAEKVESYLGAVKRSKPVGDNGYGC